MHKANERHHSLHYHKQWVGPRDDAPEMGQRCDMRHHVDR